MEDANEYYLNKYLEAQEASDRKLEQFESEVLSMIDDLRRFAKDYDYCDYTDELYAIIKKEF